MRRLSVNRIDRRIKKNVTNSPKQQGPSGVVLMEFLDVEIVVRQRRNINFQKESHVLSSTYPTHELVTVPYYGRINKTNSAKIDRSCELTPIYVIQIYRKNQL